MLLVPSPNRIPTTSLQNISVKNVPEVNLMGGVDPFLEAICPGFSPRNMMIEKPMLGTS